MDKEKTKKVMANVMAALNTWGVEYDTTWHGFSVEKSLSQIDREETVEFGEGDFKAKFDEFIERPHYLRVRGACWADDGGYVVIQMARRYLMSQEDWEDYAAWCGCSSPEEAQCNYGDPYPSYIRMNIRIVKGQIDSFVRAYARYCW